MGTIGGLIRKEMKWGGLMWGNGIRLNDQQIFLQESGSQFHSFDKILPHPCIIVHCIGIPHNFDDMEWAAEDLYFPVGHRFERMRFLAPRANKLTGASYHLASHRERRPTVDVCLALPRATDNYNRYP